ncbi:hypothetical protein FRC03_001114 [Tulasnella sp. 419]|nr:hypothetical protein FRC02_005844 [Tulasnella sp. 418]KAG8964963.1 hypothetical protein FRC03_001114 [Tulasnella sp. 419]
MDDLIASFASSAHISQEAIDLAALQAQLSQSLMQYNPQGYSTTPTSLIINTSANMHHGMQTQRPNTPIAQSPIASWNDVTSDGNSRRSQSRGPMYPSREPSMSSRFSDHRQQYDTDEMDMQMVEDELFDVQEGQYDPKGVWVPRQHQTSSPQSIRQASNRYNQPIYENQASSSLAASYSSYAAMDPFFAASLQAAQNPPSYFGRPPAPARAFVSSHSSAFATPSS